MLFVRGEEGFRAPDRHPQSALRHLRRGRPRAGSRDWILARAQQVKHVFCKRSGGSRISLKGEAPISKMGAQNYYLFLIFPKDRMKKLDREGVASVPSAPLDLPWRRDFRSVFTQV